MALQPRSYLFSRPAPEFDGSKYDRKRSVQKPRSSVAKEEKKEMSIVSASPPRPTSSASIDIPARPKNDIFQDARRHTQVKKQSRERKKSSEPSVRRPRAAHLDSVSPSVAALLAITSIPRQKSDSYIQYRHGAAQRLTVDAILQHGSLEEKDSMSFGKSPMDVLLSPPEYDEEINESEAGRESVMSTRTLSSESMPSLDGDSISDASPTLGSIMTPPRGRRSLPSRRIQSISSQAGTMADDHPLSSPEIEIDELDFRVFERTTKDIHEDSLPPSTPDLVVPRRKSAFKSNLTASLKALKSAAKSFSSLTAPMITPDDFLTRSIISIDPRVPFTDERMPPRLEDTPTPALRRYLNPTTNAPIEAHIPNSLAQTSTSTQCTASIQMQTYKISRSKKGAAPSVISRRTQSTSEEAFAEVAAGPVARQRDMRENSDFIRIAVMEMAMRKKGKLDDQKPGRARWALPPRQSPTKPYAISPSGVPVRWIPVTHG